jgi:hypothetical protein
MNRVLMILILSVTVLFANPYKSLDTQTQLSIMINHFLTEEVKGILPPKPKKEKYVQEDFDPNPGQYERYYNYIQRLKAMEQTKKEALQKIDEKFRGKAAYYNGKVDVIKNEYQDIKKLSPLLQKAINNSFKVVYGKPYVSEFINKEGYVKATLQAKKIYSFDNELDLEVNFDNTIKSLHQYKKYPAIVDFTYDGEYLQIADVKIVINDKIYFAKLKNENNGKIKLKVKINDDIFQKIKIEDDK